MRAQGHDEPPRGCRRPCRRQRRADRDRRERPLRCALPPSLLRTAPRKRGAAAQFGIGPAMIRPALLLAMAGFATSALVQPLTMRPGETWLFTIDHGQPAKARKVVETASPARGEVKASVRTLFGTMMTITNNSSTGYTFQARL